MLSCAMLVKFLIVSTKSFALECLWASGLVQVKGVLSRVDLEGSHLGAGLLRVIVCKLGKDDSLVSQLDCSRLV